MRLWNRLIKASLLLFTALALVACGGASATNESAKAEPAYVEFIEGTDFNRVILTEKAAERLDIHTDVVREELVLRELNVAGEVVSWSSSEDLLAVSSTDTVSSTVTGTADFGGSTSNNEAVRVRVSLSEHDLARVDLNHSARIISYLNDSEENDEGVLAEPDETYQNGEKALADGQLHFLIETPEQEYKPGQRVRAEVMVAGSDNPVKTVPYSAIIYGLNGETWVYTVPDILTYVRELVTVDFITEDLAVLSEGPPTGTEVATVGVAELYGIDTGVGK